MQFRRIVIFKRFSYIKQSSESMNVEFWTKLVSFKAYKCRWCRSSRSSQQFSPSPCTHFSGSHSTHRRLEQNQLWAYN